jgi:glycosyltransferase EpsD
MKKVLFTATVDSHILHFHIPYLKYFKEQGYEVHVATNGDKEIPYCDKKHIISFERSPYKLNNIKAIINLRKIIMKEKYDIIHTHTPMGSVVTRIAAMRARKKHNTRVLYTAHGFHFYKGSPKLNWILFYPIEKLLSKFTDVLITINEEDYNFAKKKMNAKNIEYVPGVGIDNNKFNFDMAEKEKYELRKSLGLSKDDYVIIYPAELSKRKNQEMLINVLLKLVKEDSRFHLLLPGKDSMNNYYQDIVKENNLDNNVHFLGYRSDIAKLLKISDLAVSSARQEGLPVNIMEAQILNLPLVITSCRGNRDLVRNGVNGYVVEIDDVDDMFEKIMKIRGNKIQSSLSKEYHLENVMEVMKKIYKNN